MRRTAILSFTEKGTGLNLWLGEKLREAFPETEIESYAVSRFAHAGRLQVFRI